MVLDYEEILNRDAVGIVQDGVMSCRMMYDKLLAEQEAVKRAERSLTSEYNNMKRNIKELRLTTLTMSAEHSEYAKLCDSLKKNESEFSEVYNTYTKNTEAKIKISKDITELIEYAIDKA